MPPSLRRRAQPLPQPSSEEPFSESEEEYVEEGAGEEEEEGMEQGMPEIEGDEEGEEDEEPLASPSLPASSAPPPHYREISTLASWTASSSKPGCSIPQLRHPSTSLFWQSDGPQPHYLNIHFFKLVRIVGLRLYLDFEADESYTPTRIVLLAGSGMNDLVEWGEMRLESPKGWVWADFECVGEADSDEESDDDEDDENDIDAIGGHIGQREHAGLGLPMLPTHTHDISDSENAAPAEPPPFRTTAPLGATLDPEAMLLDPQIPHLPHPHQATPTLPRPQPRHPFTPLSPNTSPHSQPRTRKPKTPVLRCHLVQIKILENHQNGKDTHLRGLQIFARDNEWEVKKPMVSVRGAAGGAIGGLGGIGEGIGRGERRRMGGLTRSEWMAEPSIR